jgi:putative ABC transport system ATP-binding protein
VTNTMPTPAEELGRPASGRLAARAEAITKIYGSGDARVIALDAVTVGIPRGGFIAVMGPSGSGKSTLMHCMAGLDTVDAGRVLVGDVDLTRLDERQLTRLRRDRVGFVFQAFNLVPTLTALENITLPIDIAGRRADRDWLDTVIDTVGCAAGLATPARWARTSRRCGWCRPSRRRSGRGCSARSRSTC